MARLDQHPQTAHVVRFYDPTTCAAVAVLMTGAEGSHEAMRVAVAWAVRCRPRWRYSAVDGGDWITLDVATANHTPAPAVEGCTCKECGDEIVGGDLCDACRAKVWTARDEAEAAATKADAVEEEEAKRRDAVGH